MRVSDQLRVGDRVAVLGGVRGLAVVGESFYQENLWRLVGPHRPGQRVRKDVLAVLVPQPDNPHHPDAVAVRVNGLPVGYLSRADTRAYRPGLLALQRSRRLPIALTGVISGTAWLGVRLDIDPADFGVIES